MCSVDVQPSNEAELCNAVATAIAIDDQPSCFRFPRGNGLGVDFAEYGVAKNHKGTPWEVSPGLPPYGNCMRALGCLMTRSRLGMLGSLLVRAKRSGVQRLASHARPLCTCTLLG